MSGSSKESKSDFVSYNFKWLNMNYRISLKNELKLLTKKIEMEERHNNQWY